MLEIITYEPSLSVKTQLIDIHSYPIHNHRDFQIFYVLEGELSLTLFYAAYRLQPGSIHIVHSEDVHSIESITDNNLVLVLSFDSDYFKGIFPHFITTVFITNIEEGAFEKRDTLRDQIFAIVAEECNKSPGYVSRINNAAVSLINTLMKNFRGFVIDPLEKAFIHKTSHDYMQVDRISRIIQYVYENYPYKISLAEIAKKEQMSAYYLSHIFHKLVGVNFRDFLSMVRIEMSVSSVLSTKKSITQIAQAMGFSDVKYYVRHFYDYMGCHPKEYRKKYANKIYGVIDPVKEAYPISHIKPIINKYTPYPVFKDDITKSTHIEIDFSAKPIGRLSKMNNFFSAIDDVYTDISHTNKVFSDISKIYEDVLPHESSIEILQKLVKAPHNFALPIIHMIDHSDSNDGLFTANGLKKPLYYLLRLLETLPENIIEAGANYIALQNEKDKYLIAFNPDPSDNITIDIIARNVLLNYKLTKYKLSSEKSCLNFWAQLNFRSRLDIEDIKNINYMSRPDVAFEIVPSWEQYYTSVNLLPHDIMLLKFIYEISH